MMEDAKPLIWLKVRHMRTALVWWCYLAGTDPIKDKDREDRLYQLYIALFFAISLCLSWTALLNGSTQALSTLNPASASAIVFMLPWMPLSFLLASAVWYAVKSPVKLKPADISFVVSTPLNLTWFVMVDAALAACMLGAAAALVSFALLTGLSGTLQLPFPLVGIICFIGLASAAAPLIAAAGTYRFERTRLNRAAFVEKHAKRADFNHLEQFARFNPLLYREMRQRMRVSRRQPHFALRAHEGETMMLARSGLSLVRQPEDLYRIFLWGIVEASYIWILMHATNPGFAVMGLIGVVVLMDQGRVLTRLFHDDLRVRHIRDRLPLSTLSLLGTDSLLPFTLATLSAGLVLALLLPVSIDLALAVILAALFSAATVLSGGLDAFDGSGRFQPSFEVGLFVVALVLGGVSLLQSATLLVVCAACLVALYALMVKAAR